MQNPRGLRSNSRRQGPRRGPEPPASTVVLEEALQPHAFTSTTSTASNPHPGPTFLYFPPRLLCCSLEQCSALTSHGRLLFCGAQGECAGAGLVHEHLEPPKHWTMTQLSMLHLCMSRKGHLLRAEAREAAYGAGRTGGHTRPLSQPPTVLMAELLGSRRALAAEVAVCEPSPVLLKCPISLKEQPKKSHMPGTQRGVSALAPPSCPSHSAKKSVQLLDSS